MDMSWHYLRLMECGFKVLVCRYVLRSNGKLSIISTLLCVSGLIRIKSRKKRTVITQLEDL